MPILTQVVIEAAETCRGFAGSANKAGAPGCSDTVASRRFGDHANSSHRSRSPISTIPEIELSDAPPSSLPARRGTRVFLLAMGVAQFCALARYVLLARLLGPQQLGFAATLILTAQFFDAVTNTGGEHYLVQNRAGDQPEVQRLVHTTTIMRGLLSALGLVVCAAPMARFFGQPSLAPALATLAAAPLLLGFLHLDLRRRQRHNDFRTEARATLVGETAGLIATATAAWLVRDYTAILYGLITRAAAMVVVSHLCAERRYRVGFSAAHNRALAAFSLPLMLNGVVLFAGSQGDRVLVANTLGPAVLGHYSAILLLIMYPSAMVQRALAGAYLPQLSAAAAASPRADDPANLLAGQALLLAIAMAAGFALVAPLAVLLLYGPRFGQGFVVVALIGILQSTRFLRVWPATHALALGRSRVVLAGNVIRTLCLPLALLASTWLANDLNVIIAVFVLGEVFSLLVSAALTNHAAGIPRRRALGRVGGFVVAGLLIVVLAFAAEHSMWGSFGLALAAATVSATMIARRERYALRAAIAAGRTILP